MANVRGNLDPIARSQVEAMVAILEPQHGRTGQQNDELILGLVVPEARRARLAGRDDPFDPHVDALDQPFDRLLVAALRQDREKIAAEQRLALQGLRSVAGLGAHLPGH